MLSVALTQSQAWAQLEPRLTTGEVGEVGARFWGTGCQELIAKGPAWVAGWQVQQGRRLES